MTGVPIERFQETFWHFFPFLDVPDLNHKTLASPSSSIVHIVSCKLLGVDFMSTGVTEDEAKRTICKQMTDFLATCYDVAVVSECKLLGKKDSISPSSLSYSVNSVEKRFKQHLEHEANKVFSKSSQSQSFVSLLYEHAAKLREKQPEFDYFVERNLFGCKAKFLHTEYLVEPKYRKKNDAKEAICKYILTNLLK